MKKKKLSKRKKIRIAKKAVPIVILLVLVGLFTIYIKYTDKKSKELLDESKYIYTQNNIVLGDAGFNKIDFKINLEEFLSKKDIENSSLTYKMTNESFSFDIQVKKQGEEYVFIIDRIIDEAHNMHAKMKYEGVTRIDYQTGNENHATVLRLFTESDSKYLAITGNTYYFLGSDIENISFINGEFYYLSYNRKYSILKTASICDKNLKNSIDEFKSSEYYYKYGKINFLTDYYQKLSSSVFTVEARCNELENAIVEDVDI